MEVYTLFPVFLIFWILCIELATSAPKYVYPKLPHYQNIVVPLFSHLNQSRMVSFVRKFTSFNSRFARNNKNDSDEAERWLNMEIQLVVAASEVGSISIRKIADPLKGSVRAYHQENIIVQVEGHDPELKDEVIILGAHFDSVNGRDSLKQDWRRAPGADDNAAGCSVLLEVLRLITQVRMKFKRTVEFHWYAAEELGIRGSHDVVEQYVKNMVRVKGMLNLDMIGYQSAKYGKTIKVFNEETDFKLTAFVKMIIGKYIPEYKLLEGNCGGRCNSDHASWTWNGYPAAHVKEAKKTPYIHTEMDTIETVNFEQVNEFAKLSVAFVTELAQLPGVKYIPEVSDITEVPDIPDASLESSFLKQGWIIMWLKDIIGKIRSLGYGANTNRAHVIQHRI